MTTTHARWAAVVAIVLGFANERTVAGLVIVERQTTIRAEGRAGTESFDLADGTTGTGSFTGSVGDSITSGVSTSRAAASQTSDPGLDGDALAGTASGAVAANVGELSPIAARGQSTFRLVFDVLDLPTPFSLRGSLDATIDATSGVTLTTPLAPGPLFERERVFGDPGTTTFDQTLLLAPGRYELLVEAVANGTPQNNAAAFDVAFATRPGPVIPLPPACWAGGAGVAAVIAWTCRRQRAHGPRRRAVGVGPRG